MIVLQSEPSFGRQHDHAYGGRCTQESLVVRAERSEIVPEESAVARWIASSLRSSGGRRAPALERTSSSSFSAANTSGRADAPNLGYPASGFATRGPQGR